MAAASFFIPSGGEIQTRKQKLETRNWKSEDAALKGWRYRKFETRN